MMGVAADMQIGSLSNVTDANATSNGTEDYFYGLSADLKIGYAPTSSVSVYALGSVLAQKFGSTGAGGFGYGGGINYAVSDSFAVEAQYKAYAMTYDGLVDYDYTVAGINLKYTW